MRELKDAVRVADAAADRAPGVVVGGKYRLGNEIGAGGMGRVMAAEHLMLKGSVALKLLPAAKDTAHRLLREARAAQSLRSENVIRVYDVGLDAGRPYIVMERLVGANLRQVVEREGTLAVAAAVDCVIQACAGLAEAHAAGIVHRDIKPSNLFLTRTHAGEPLVKILDFGISKTPFFDLPGERTADDALLGSPAYMSPEQLRHPSRVDGRTDVWALAVTLYWLTTRAQPFSGTTFMDMSVAIAAEPYVPLAVRLADAPADLDRVLGRALAKRPEERTATVQALATDLAPFATAGGQECARRIALRTGPGTTVAPNRALADEMDAGEVTVTDAGSDRSESAERTTGRPRRRWIAAWAGGAAAVVASVGWLVAGAQGDDDEGEGQGPRHDRGIPSLSTSAHQPPEPHPGGAPLPPEFESSAEPGPVSPIVGQKDGKRRSAAAARPPSQRVEPRPGNAVPAATANPDDVPRPIPAAPAITTPPPPRRLDRDGIPILE